MKMNWLIEEAKKADISKGYVILENPETKKHLDNLLTKQYWPLIWSNLEDSGFNYHPQEMPETEVELGHVLARSLTFMLSDANRLFFRGTLSCSIEHWMINSEFFLLLPKDNDPQVIFEILGNSRFRGNPPSLSIDKTTDDFYQITLNAGNGAGWGRYDNDAVVKRIKTVTVNPQGKT